MRWSNRFEEMPLLALSTGAFAIGVAFVGSALWSPVASAALGIVVTGALLLLAVANAAARRALRDNEARSRLLAEITPVGIIEGDVDGRIHFCNDAFCRITGRPREQFLSGQVGWASITPPEWLSADERAIAMVRDTGQCSPYEKEYVRPDGSRVPVLVGFTLFGEERRRTAAFILDLTARKLAEREIRDGESRFKATFDNAAVGIALVSRDGRWLQVNDRLCAIVGYTRDELLSSSFQAITHPADLLTDLALAEEVARGARPHYSLEKRYLRKDGGWAWVNLTVSAKQAEDGSFDHFISMVEDISKRHDAEESLMAALNASRTGTFRWNIVTNEIWWDDSLRHLFGLPSGAPITSIDDFLQRVHPDHREPVLSELRRCHELGQDFDLELKIVLPDGTERWIYDRGRALRDHTGRPVMMTGACVDITERKLAEQDIRERELMLRAVTDNSPDMLSRFDRDLRHVFVNPAVLRLSGLPASSFLGRTNREMGMPAHLCRLWEDALHSVFSRGQAVGIEFEYQGVDQLHYFSSRCIPETGPDGQVEHVLCVAHDRTAERQAHQALKEADHRKDEFLATLAHELRNPLAPLRNGLSILQRLGGTSDIVRVRDMMERQLAHMVRLVDDLLDVSRVTTGKVTLRKEFITLQTAVQFAIEATRPMVEAAGHRLETVMPSGSVWVHGDQTRLAQVINNLLTNAAKYTPAGGHLKLVVSVEGAHAVVEVSDNGVGIPADSLERVFEMFSQVNASLERSQGGLGIGLALVRALVELHHGSVSVRSEGVGLGSTFLVRIPAVDEALAKRSFLPALMAEAPVKPRRILAVDDNEDAVSSLAEMLKLDGHTVRIALDGASALRALEDYEPDFVFLDIGMPGLDGHEVARRMRAMKGFSNTRLVALTGWGSEEDKALSVAAGFDFHLTKPVSVAALQLVLNENPGQSLAGRALAI
jgi:PAS domain S-box-containing protein